MQPCRTVLRSQLTKTRMCSYYVKGHCNAGSSCRFAHCEDEIQVVPDLQKTKLCQAFTEGRCDKVNCSFAHGTAELRTTEIFYKTKLCTWNVKGRCQNGDSCRFAHDESELKPQMKHGGDAAATFRSTAALEDDYGSCMKVATSDSLDTMVPSDTASTASGTPSRNGSKSVTIDRLHGELAELTARFQMLEMQLHVDDNAAGHGSSEYESVGARGRATGSDVGTENRKCRPCYIAIDGTCTWDYTASVGYGTYVQTHDWPLAVTESNVQQDVAVLFQSRAAESSVCHNL